MSQYQFVLHIDAPPERVYDAWTDLSRMPEWVEGVTKVTDITGPMDRVGTRYVVWFGRLASRGEVLAGERPRLFRTRIASWVLKAENEARFEPEGTGTRLVQTFRVQGLVSRLWARTFASGSWKGSIRGELQAFGRLVEMEARAPGVSEDAVA